MKRRADNDIEEDESPTKKQRTDDAINMLTSEEVLDVNDPATNVMLMTLSGNMNPSFRDYAENAFYQAKREAYSMEEFKTNYVNKLSNWLNNNVRVMPGVTKPLASEDFRLMLHSWVPTSDIFNMEEFRDYLEVDVINSMNAESDWQAFRYEGYRNWLDTSSAHNLIFNRVPQFQKIPGTNRPKVVNPEAHLARNATRVTLPKAKSIARMMSTIRGKYVSEEEIFEEFQNDELIQQVTLQPDKERSRVQDDLYHSEGFNNVNINN